MKSKLALLIAGTGATLPAHAHVKWFSMMADCASAPITTLEMVSSPLFAVLALTALAAMFAVAAVDNRISRGANPAVRFAAWLDGFSANAVAPLLRIGVAVYFVSVVVYFQGSPIILTAELKTDAAWVPLVQLAIAAAMLSRRSAVVGALGITLLFGFSVSRYGAFHMLDYPFFLGVAAFLAIDSLCGQKRQLQGLGILRVTVGVSLLWCSVEKWLYPDWTLELLRSDLRFLLETGLSPALIVMGAGFVEFCLGFVIVFGRLASQVAAAVLLAIMMSAVPLVGMLDLVGHLPILVVLLILAATRNPVGGWPAGRGERRDEFGLALSFLVSVPGFVAAYHLGHEILYGAWDKLSWTEALVGAGLVALLLARAARTAPHTYREVYRWNSAAG